MTRDNLKSIQSSAELHLCTRRREDRRLENISETRTKSNVIEERIFLIKKRIQGTVQNKVKKKKTNVTKGKVDPSKGVYVPLGTDGSA